MLFLVVTCVAIRTRTQFSDLSNVPKTFFFCSHDLTMTLLVPPIVDTNRHRCFHVPLIQQTWIQV
jgi:hypothetical protein